MATKIKFNLKNINKKLLDESEKHVEKVLKKVFLDIKLFSPIDSGTYENSHNYKGIIRSKNKIIGTIENIGEYSERVETGFRQKAVNWNLVNLGTIYISSGANVYKRALEKNRKYFN